MFSKLWEIWHVWLGNGNCSPDELTGWYCSIPRLAVMGDNRISMEKPIARGTAVVLRRRRLGSSGPGDGPRIRLVV